MTDVTAARHLEWRIKASDPRTTFVVGRRDEAREAESAPVSSPLAGSRQCSADSSWPAIVSSA
jgi:hypothetical protein